MSNPTPWRIEPTGRPIMRWQIERRHYGAGIFRECIGPFATQGAARREIARLQRRETP